MLQKEQTKARVVKWVALSEPLQQVGAVFQDIDLGRAEGAAETAIVLPKPLRAGRQQELQQVHSDRATENHLLNGYGQRIG